MLTTNRLCIAIGTCALVAGTAYAEEASCEEEAANCPAPVTKPVVAPAPAPMPPPPAAPWYRRVGWGLTAGGGVDAFVAGSAESQTDVGGGWNVRGTMGTREWFAGEAVYFGSAQGINAIGLSNGANLIGNGLQADLRINMTRDYPAQPFVYGGMAWRNYQLTNDNINLSDVSGSANVFELPLGIGLAGYYRGFMADARAEYRWAWGNDLIAGNTDMDRWNVTGNLGVEF